MLRGGDCHNHGKDGTSEEKDDDGDDVKEFPYRVYLAVGSNLGNRFENIRNALELLCQPSHNGSISNNNNSDNSSITCTTRLVQTSFLHETPPMYVTDQPPFLNGAVELATHLAPLELLQQLKRIESQLGRDIRVRYDESGNVIRNGPRPVDLDILFYEARSKADGVTLFRRQILQSEILTIPHPRIQERHFVLQPLLEVAGPSYVHPVLNATIQELCHQLHQQEQSQKQHGGQDNDENRAVRVLPLPRNRFLYWNETVLIMGILNVTPDSFSDGGQYDGVEVAARRALDMMQKEGATIIDVGGESTRPGADEISVDEELQRTIPVIQRIREMSKDIVISIDTRRAAVAQAAVQAGADIVNDVSGGAFDPDMFRTVASLGVPMVLMHMRGTPQTMQSMTDYGDGDQDGDGGCRRHAVVEAVSTSLARTSQMASQAGIPRWLQIVDPGIGFAKDMKGNLWLLRNLASIRKATGNLPILLGTSRKGFLGKIAGVEKAADRDYATIASCVASLCLETITTTTITSTASLGTILRVHNPAAMVQAIKVMDAIRQIPKVD